MKGSCNCKMFLIQDQILKSYFADNSIFSRSPFPQAKCELLFRGAQEKKTMTTTTKTLVISLQIAVKLALMSVIYRWTMISAVLLEKKVQ